MKETIIDAVRVVSASPYTGPVLLALACALITVWLLGPFGPVTRHSGSWRRLSFRQGYTYARHPGPPGWSGWRCIERSLRGDCDDFAWTMLVLSRGSRLAALRAVLTGDAAFWLVRSPVNRRLPRHVIVRYGSQWFDSADPSGVLTGHGPNVLVWRIPFAVVVLAVVWPAVRWPVLAAALLGLALVARSFVF